MLDMSMENTDRGPIVHTLSGGARTAAMELKPGDRVALASFSGNAKTLLPLTDDVRKFEYAVRNTGNRMVQRSQRHLYDSLLTALNVFPEAAQSDRRRCIVVLTTASDAGSRRTAGDVALAARSKSVAIFVALISPQPSPPHIMPGGRVYPKGPNANASEEKKTLEPLARRTGGEVRVYVESQYVIARAIGDMVNQPESPISAPSEAGMATHSPTAPDTRLVSLDVRVVDARTGEVPELLGPRDFEVYADGQRIPIRNLEIETPPMDLVFLIYLSNPGLSSPLDRKRYGQGLRAAVTALRREDRAGVIRGSGTRGVLLPMTGDQAAIREALLRRAQPDKNRLFDAAASALSLLSGQTSLARRRAIIAITDDIERHSETKEDALEEGLLRAGVTLHEVMLALIPAGSHVWGKARLGPIQLPEINGAVGGGVSPSGGSLVNLVRATGGESPIGDDFDVALPALIHRLRMRYILTVAAPAAARAFHKIEVGLTPESRLAHPNSTVCTRVGYYSEP
jgi:VWFA-related protein